MNEWEGNTASMQQCSGFQKSALHVVMIEFLVTSELVCPLTLEHSQ